MSECTCAHHIHRETSDVLCFSRSLARKGDTFFETALELYAHAGEQYLGPYVQDGYARDVCLRCKSGHFQVRRLTLAS